MWLDTPPCRSCEGIRIMYLTNKMIVSSFSLIPYGDRDSDIRGDDRPD